MIRAEINYRINCRLGRAWLERALSAANRILKKKENYQVSVAIVGKKRMRTLNKEYRAKDAVTDVLSFSSGDKKDFVSPQKEPILLGEIVICFPVAKKQAGSGSVAKEIQRLFVHGLLHLLGYRHGSGGAYKKMFALQNEIINKIK